MNINLLNTKETAKLLRVKEGTLRMWRSVKRYNLPYIKIGGKVFYRMEDIQAFIDNRIIKCE